MTSTPDTPVLDKVKLFFEEVNWPYSQMKDPGLLQLVYIGEKASWTCYARAREEHSQFIFYSLCPLNAPEPLRYEVAEFITRINYGLMLGSFEMDFEDGEVRCKTGISVEGTALNSALIKPVVFANVLIMERYLQGFTAVMSGYLTPIEALVDIEAPST